MKEKKKIYFRAHAQQKSFWIKWYYRNRISGTQFRKPLSEALVTMLKELSLVLQISLTLTKHFADTHPQYFTSVLRIIVIISEDRSIYYYLT